MSIVNDRIRDDRAEMADSGRFLQPAVSQRIEHALRKVGDFGEVRLVVVKGQLRFIKIVQSENLDSVER